MSAAPSQLCGVCGNPGLDLGESAHPECTTRPRDLVHERDRDFLVGLLFIALILAGLLAALLG